MPKKMHAVEIRKLFHDIPNLLNIITVKSGVTLEQAKTMDFSKMPDNQLREYVMDMLEILKIVESSAQKTGVIIEKIKTMIYQALDIDNSTQ